MSQETSVNNKRIAKNTLFLYMRMIVVMAIGLYTVRAILEFLLNVIHLRLVFTSYSIMRRRAGGCEGVIGGKKGLGSCTFALNS